MSRKRGLGRGLDALLSASASAEAATATGTADGDSSNAEDAGLKQLPVDLVQRGRYQPRKDIEPESLAAVAVGASVWFFGFALALGLLMAISPIAARHYGADRPELIGRYTRQGMYLGLGIGTVVIALIYLNAPPTCTSCKVWPTLVSMSTSWRLAVPYMADH